MDPPTLNLAIFLFAYIVIRDLRETIESGPLFITDLFQSKFVAYFQSIFISIRICLYLT